MVKDGINMLTTALVFFLLALAAALFGFEVIASGFAAVAKIIFWMFLAISLISLVVGLVRRPAMY
jgi:uncharacterized membrane protein YtjA (UPF0391 family)